MKSKNIINNIQDMDFTDFTIKTIEGWLEEDASAPIIKSDIYEDNNHLIVEVDVPGVEQNNLECFIYNNNIYIQGLKLESIPLDLLRYNQIERTFGNFTKSIPIPTTCDTKNVKAVLKNGVLRIILKKIEERRRMKTIIKIEKE